ncbi:MAG: hypothetical protein O7D86_05510 [Proteobacteria bacterium]|nr:hypothetical protein [Pseudomonadota bacterium]
MEKIVGDSEHRKRKRSLSNAVSGVLSSASLIVHRIGLGLAVAKDLLGKHAIKQADRLSSNEKLTVWERFIYSVPYVIGARKERVVAIDWTDVDSDKQTTLAINLLTRHGRATPLLWKTVSKRSLKRNRSRYEKEVLPKGVHVTVLADRGVGYTDFYEVLRPYPGC